MCLLLAVLKLFKSVVIYKICICYVATVFTACGMYQLNSIKPPSESFWFARGFYVLVFLNIFIVICFVYLRCSQRVMEI